MRAVTQLPLVAMPNAGMPREVEGRNIYLTSPEYMASFAKKVVRAGATFVGGCCGTTPAHIRAMRGALRALEAQDSGESSGGKIAPVANTSARVAALGVRTAPNMPTTHQTIRPATGKDSERLARSSKSARS